MRSSALPLNRLLASATASSLLLTLTLSPTLAFADAPRRFRVAVIDVGGNKDSDSTDIHYFVEKGIRTKPGQLDPSAIDQVLNAGGEANDLQNIAFGRESLTTGRLAFKTQRCDDALEPLSQAVTFFEQSFAFLDEPEPYLEALTLQAACLDRKGQKAEAVAVLEKALIVQPDLESSLVHGAETALEQASAKVRDRDLSSIAVSTQPEASRVFVDGRYRGVSPAYRPGLRRGLHFVHVERQGFARRGATVDTDSGDADSKVDVTMEPARRRGVLDALLPGIQTEFGAPDAPKDGAIVRLQSALLVDFAILFRASGGSGQKRIEMALYDLTTGRRVNQVDGTVNWENRDRVAKDTVMELVGKLADVAVQQQVALVPEPASDPGAGTSAVAGTPYFKTWWFWTLIGVGVAGVAAGIAVPLALSGDDAPAGVPQDGNGAILLRF